MSKKQRKQLVRILITAVLFAAVFLITEGHHAHEEHSFNLWHCLLYLLPYLFIGWDILWRAARNLVNGQVFDENFLMSVATIGAFVSGDYHETVAVMLLYQIGELCQSVAVGKSRRSIRELMDIRPLEATVERDGEAVTVAPEEVAVGELLLVRPGDKIPLDGTVEEGQSSVNTVALTGESTPRSVIPGDTVISGCVNVSGLLRVRVTRPYAESTVAKVLELVEESSARKARSEQFITRFARWYTPFVVGAAMALAVLPPLFVGNWGEWFHRALTFLVISCPCALVISVPLSFFGGIGAASRRGILIKGAGHLEALSAVDTVVFDKTGTLTRGNFTVTAVHPHRVSEARIVELAALAECYSSHPIAQSLREAYGASPDTSRVQNAEELAGLGLRAVVDHQTVCVGNEALLESLGIDWHADCHHSGTVIHVALENEYVGHIEISDTIKEEASAALASLCQQGIRRTVMLTGDKHEVAAQTGETLGISEVYGELLPADKVEKVEALLQTQAPRKKLMFVGDGINDAPVLCRADVGVAMGALGSDAAIEAADVVLMDDQLSKLALAIRIARRTRRIVFENIVFALGVKAVVLVWGALGEVGLWLAVFADVGVAMLAILNAMRTLKAPKENSVKKQQ